MLRMRNKIHLKDLSLPQQNYVEAISDLIENHGHAHTTEIAKLLKIKKPSVTEAISRLVEIGVVQKLGNELMHRHKTLQEFMRDVLEMDPKEADETACRIEHSASPKFIKRLLLLKEFIQVKNEPNFKKKFSQFIKTQKKKAR